MKIRHRIPTRSQETTSWDEADDPKYAAEVRLHTERLVRDYKAAEKRLERALKRAERAQQPNPRRARGNENMSALWAEVEIRRQELRRIEELMVASPQSATHRGTRSYRPIPIVSKGN